MTSLSKAAVVARAPAKINLILRVGQPDQTGYHPLTTVFQALDMWDEVTVAQAETDRLDIDGDGDLSGVPTDSTNIVWRAVDALAEVTGHREPLHIAINKTIPVAGGMAGGSADAAATLVAVNELWQLGLSPEELEGIGRRLGADVPFSLLGGLALGEGRGDELTVLTRVNPLHCVVVTSDVTLSTPLVYSTLDDLREGVAVHLRDASGRELAAVTGAAMDGIGDILVNDLQPATLQCVPSIRGTLDAVAEAGALVSMVSGSGPTVWGACLDEAHSIEVANRMRSRGFAAKETVSTALGAHLTSPPSSPKEGR